MNILNFASYRPSPQNNRPLNTANSLFWQPAKPAQPDVFFGSIQNWFVEHDLPKLYRDISLPEGITPEADFRAAMAKTDLTARERFVLEQRLSGQTAKVIGLMEDLPNGQGLSKPIGNQAVLNIQNAAIRKILRVRQFPVGTDRMWLLHDNSPSGKKVGEILNAYLYNGRGPVIKVGGLQDNRAVNLAETDSAYAAWLRWHQEGFNDDKKRELLFEHLQNSKYYRSILKHHFATDIPKGLSRIVMVDETQQSEDEVQNQIYSKAFFERFNARSRNERVFLVSKSDMKDMSEASGYSEEGELPPYDFFYCPGKGLILNWYVGEKIYRQFCSEKAIARNDEASKLRAFAVALKRERDKQQSRLEAVQRWEPVGA